MNFSNTSGVLQFDDGSMLLINVNDLNIGAITMTGGAHDDQLIASWTQNDRLVGNAGNDLLIGGGGDNQMYGGSGNDTLFGWGGNDYMSGGSGSDTFVVYGGSLFGATNGHDTISDFTAGPGGDMLDIADAVTLAAAGINFDGGGHLVASANVVQSGADTLILLSGSGVDSVRLMGVTLTNLTTTNFDNTHFNIDNGSSI